MNKMLLSLVLVLTSVGCAGSPKENIFTAAFPCLANVMSGTHDALCNNHDLQRWQQWKAQSPNAPIGQGAYERDLFSGRIYRKGECPREGWVRLHHWCLD